MLTPVALVGFSLWTVLSAKEMPAVFIGVHKLPGNGGQIQSIRQILVDFEEHHVVEGLLGHGRSQVGFDALEGRKGPFSSCSGNRDCEIDPHQFVYLTKHVGSQWCSGKHVCQGANPGDPGGMSRAAVQKIWQHGVACLSSFLMSMSLLYKS